MHNITLTISEAELPSWRSFAEANDFVTLTQHPPTETERDEGIRRVTIEADTVLINATLYCIGKVTGVALYLHENFLTTSDH